MCQTTIETTEKSNRYRKEMIGQKFNKLTVISLQDYDVNGARWLCRCDCGNITVVSGKKLRSGGVKSCGCLNQENARKRLKDLTGKKFGRLQMMEYIGQHYWLAKCECGKICKVRSDWVVSGRVVSCGCHSRQKLSERMSTHRQSKTRLYRIWAGMKNRCTNPNDHTYERYGKRGITLCKEWEGFENFYQWALSNGYASNLTIDRIDNNGNYCPENCRWSDTKTQVRNRRTTILVTYNGEEKTLGEWCEKLNLPYHLMWERIIRFGWSATRAFETSKKETNRWKKKI